MNNSEINKQNFQDLIEKYLDGKTSLEEVKLLVNYYESFQQKNDWVESLGPEDAIQKRMLINILEAIQEEEIKDVNSVPVYKLKIFKYGVAASIILFISFNFIFNKNNNLITEPDNVPVIVKNNIKIGSDKAILTLENGTNITLEKGQSYQSKNLNSNGQELVYNSTDNSTPKLEYNYLTIQRGGQYFVQLADGTKVWLNSDSKLKYPVKFIEGETRQVELVYGEAYFDVSPSTNHKGAGFKVNTLTQEVSVLGTEFNIKAYKDDDHIYTTLVEGKVEVGNDMLKKILKPNEQANVNIINNSIVLGDVDVYNETSWKKGIFSFKNKSLKEIMKVMSRWYDIDITFDSPKLEDLKFNGVLSKTQNIENILLTIKTTTDFSYDINDNYIRIK